MRTEQEIKDKIESLGNDLEELHKDRQSKMTEYGGLSQEENLDFHIGVTKTVSEIRALEWVLCIKK